MKIVKIRTNVDGSTSPANPGTPLGTPGVMTVINVPDGVSVGDVSRKLAMVAIHGTRFVNWEQINNAAPGQIILA